MFAGSREDCMPSKKETDLSQNKIDSHPALLNEAKAWPKKALNEQGVGAKIFWLWIFQSIIVVLSLFETHGRKAQI
jgi:hypothetical protein